MGKVARGWENPSWRVKNRRRGEETRGDEKTAQHRKRRLNEKGTLSGHRVDSIRIELAHVLDRRSNPAAIAVSSDLPNRAPSVGLSCHTNEWRVPENRASLPQIDHSAPVCRANRP